ncbi:MAG TPA: hypothetical protein VGI23_07395 [Steroidobacteraceae bacterium]|jgi:hypothetical protein
MNDRTLRVSYLELIQAPAPSPARLGEESISAEKLPVNEYLMQSAGS